VTDNDIIPDAIAADPQTLQQLLPHLRHKCDNAVRQARSDRSSQGTHEVRQGAAEAWQEVVDRAVAHVSYTSASAYHRLSALHEELQAAAGKHGSLPGYRGVYDLAVEMVGKALRRAAADQDVPLMITRSAGQWAGYPKVLPPDHPVEDMKTLCLFLGGDDTSFTGDLLRLIAKADPGNLNRLSAAFPRHVAAYLMYRACAPVPARTLVALLEASTYIAGGNRADTD
jgi:hypothetical protein